MSNHLTGYITTGPVTHPEAAWAKAAGLPHLTYGSAQIVAIVLVVMVAALVLVGGFKALVK